MDPIINKRAARVIPVARPSITDVERDAVAGVMAGDWISGGPKVEEFERQFAEAHGATAGVACNSGTTALHLALVAAGVGRGDRVLLPTLTMVAVANAVLYCGATPVFLDSCDHDGNADPGTIPLGWFRPHYRAAIVPHLYGIPAVDYSNFLRDLLPCTRLIHDCAESHYATHAGNPLTHYNVGELATFSFYANKIVTTGEGGMVLLNGEPSSERLRGLRAHSFTLGNHFHHRELAFGYRMTDLQAAVGLAQHERRTEILSRRQVLVDLYRERLKKIRWLRQLTSPPWIVSTPRQHANWIMPIVLAHDAPLDRDILRHKLGYAGIDTRSFFHPLHRQPHLKQFAGRRTFPVADDLSRRGLYLPLYPDLTEQDVDYIVDAIESAV